MSNLAELLHASGDKEGGAKMQQQILDIFGVTEDEDEATGVRAEEEEQNQREKFETTGVAANYGAAKPVVAKPAAAVSEESSKVVEDKVAEVEVKDKGDGKFRGKSRLGKWKVAEKTAAPGWHPGSR
jgi:hypothetical protein